MYFSTMKRPWSRSSYILGGLVMWLSPYFGIADQTYSFDRIDVDGISLNGVKRIYQDSDKQIWLLMESGVVRFDGKEFTRAYDEVVYDIIEGSGSDHLLASKKGLKVGDELLLTNDGLKHNVVKRLYRASDGIIWIGTEGGINKFKDGKLLKDEMIIHLPSKRTSSIIESAQKEIWVGTNNGIWRWNYKQERTMGRDDGLSHQNISKLFVDLEGYIWIGTFGGGLHKYEPNTNTLFSTPHGLECNWIYDIVVGSYSELLVASDNGLYVVKEQRADRLFSEFTVVFSLMLDHEMSIWMGTDQGLYLLIPNTPMDEQNKIISDQLETDSGTVEQDEKKAEDLENDKNEKGKAYNVYYIIGFLIPIVLLGIVIFRKLRSRQ